MTRRHLASAAVVLTAGLVATGCGGSKKSSAPPATTTTGTSGTSAALAGSVGPGFDISLTDGGQPVKSLSAGTYTLNVDDKADIHNFHLSGPGVDVKTDVGFTGTKSFTVTLQAGTYSFVCDIHPTMKGSFSVS